MKHDQLNVALSHRLDEIVGAVPDVRSIEVIVEVPDSKGRRADVVATVTLTEGRAYTLVLEALTVGQPRHARAAADHVTSYADSFLEHGAPNPVGIVGAPYFSERSAAVLQEQGVGYVDLAGNARLAFGPVYVERTGHANPHADDRPLAALFAPKTSRVARALLAHPARAWRLQELADEIGVSLGLVAKAKASLLDAEYARDSPDGLILTDPGGLLDAWIAADRRPKPHAYYSLDPLPETERRVAAAARQLGARAVLTAFSGAEHVAPHVRYTRADALVERGALTEVAERAGLRPVSTGANVHLHESRDDGAFYGAQDAGGLPVAHPVQLVLDLAREKGRGEEAADFLRRHVLAPTWASPAHR